MRIKEFIDTIVLDKDAYEVGRVSDIDFNKETGKIETVVLTLKKNIFTTDELEISFDDIKTIGAYIILNKEIDFNEKADEIEAQQIEIEDADEK
ncbi:PRC-barrel domain-containing protein [Methanobrevibacter oralis]|uniref:PRC-barrel domain protein n=1 Tax=Methanobrevibacter oralis TaxID=66851 RepID=A0A166BMU1_METOA|nr:PRC-barrel domain-containing protein [Methanobrevibacter oralis]KZX13571.1 PRC-barrel domain protein [Methanobrevibacter oralis]